jgi:hypothetical protein
VRVGDGVVPVGKLVGHNRAEPTGSLHLGTFVKPVDEVSTVAEHDLALDVEAAQ